MAKHQCKKVWGTCFFSFRGSSWQVERERREGEGRRGGRTPKATHNTEWLVNSTALLTSCILDFYTSDEETAPWTSQTSSAGTSEVWGEAKPHGQRLHFRGSRGGELQEHQEGECLSDACVRITREKGSWKGIQPPNAQLSPKTMGRFKTFVEHLNSRELKYSSWKLARP